MRGYVGRNGWQPQLIQSLQGISKLFLDLKPRRSNLSVLFPEQRLINEIIAANGPGSSASWPVIQRVEQSLGQLLGNLGGQQYYGPWNQPQILYRRKRNLMDYFSKPEEESRKWFYCSFIPY